MDAHTTTRTVSAVALAALVAAGCSATEPPNDLVLPPDGKADTVPSVFAAGFLDIGLPGEERVSERQSESFSSGVYRFHQWKVPALNVFRVVIETGDTFEPALLVRFWVRTGPGRASVQPFWITPEDGLVPQGNGRYEATLVMGSDTVALSSRLSPGHVDVLVTSREAAGDMDARVAETAAYEIQAVPIEPEPLELTMVAEDGSGRRELPVGPIHLEFGDVGLLTLEPEADALLARLDVRVEEPTGDSELIYDDQKVSSRIDPAFGGEEDRRRYVLSGPPAPLRLEFYEDTETDILGWEDAVVSALALHAIPNEELVSRSAVDLREESPDRRAPFYAP